MRRNVVKSSKAPLTYFLILDCWYWNDYFIAYHEIFTWFYSTLSFYDSINSPYPLIYNCIAHRFVLNREKRVSDSWFFSGNDYFQTCFDCPMKDFFTKTYRYCSLDLVWHNSFVIYSFTALNTPARYSMDNFDIKSVFQIDHTFGCFKGFKQFNGTKCLYIL